MLHPCNLVSVTPTPCKVYQHTSKVITCFIRCYVTPSKEFKILTFSYCQLVGEMLIHVKLELVIKSLHVYMSHKTLNFSFDYLITLTCTLQIHYQCFAVAQPSALNYISTCNNIFVSARPFERSVRASTQVGVSGCCVMCHNLFLVSLHFGAPINADPYHHSNFCFFEYS